MPPQVQAASNNGFGLDECGPVHGQSAVFGCRAARFQGGDIDLPWPLNVQVQFVAATLSLLPVPMANVPQLSWFFRKFDKQKWVARNDSQWHKQQWHKLGDEQGN